MIRSHCFALAALALTLSVPLALHADEKAAALRRAQTVVLSETGVKNLQIETLEAEETVFEESLFTLGRIEAIPGRIAAVSSRIAGRISELKALPGDPVKAGQEVARLESRQPGDPPPSVPLKAPMDGIVTKLEVRLGDPLDPDKTLLEIIDLTEVYAVAHVPEPHAGRIRPGARAHVTVAAFPGEVFTCTLVRLGTSADRQSGTIDAFFRISNPLHLLRPGMRAECSIVTRTREGVTAVPRSALQGDPANRFVFVEDFELKNAFVKSPVEVGQTNHRFVEILSGLLPGDKVVTRGAYLLSFAGANSISLKEALDAAHGHEHNADGSEISPDRKAPAPATPAAHPHAHDAHAHDAHAPTGWMLTSGVLFLLFLWALARKPPALRSPSHPQPTGEVR